MLLRSNRRKFILAYVDENPIFTDLFKKQKKIYFHKFDHKRNQYLLFIPRLLPIDNIR